MRIVIFSSRTGSDALYIAKWRAKDIVFFVTNNERSPLMEDARTLTLPNRPNLEDYKVIYPLLDKADAILLMGYLRIIPKEVCERYKIYNLHPGLIDRYPELRGADPQKKALALGHKEVGCVIHECAPEVDAGKILMVRYTPVEPKDTLDDIYRKLGTLAKHMWLDFLEDFSV